MTAKEFANTTTRDICNFPEVPKWFMDAMMLRQRIVLLQDNRTRFRQRFGKPHFHYRGEFYFHCWDIAFSEGRFIIMTAKGHGTSYEQVGDCSSKTRLEFLQWLLD